MAAVANIPGEPPMAGVGVGTTKTLQLVGTHQQAYYPSQA